MSFEIRLGGKCYTFICLCRSQIQTNDEFESFLKKFELTLDKNYEEIPFMISILGDLTLYFNSILGDFKSSNWCKNDTTSNEGSMVDTVTSNYGLHQFTQEPTHILNSSSSIIDLMLISHPNLVMDSGDHSSLHPNFHDQVPSRQLHVQS